jgi:hypothetical protein
MFPEAGDYHCKEYKQRKCRGDDYVARNGETVRNQAHDVGDENEAEQGEHQRKENHGFRAGSPSQHVRDKFVEHFGRRLEPARHQRSAAGRQD